MSEAAKLFVGSLPLDTTKEQLESVFGSHGNLQEAIVLSRSGGRQHVCGFVKFETTQECEVAITALNGQPMPGSVEPMQVRFADNKNARAQPQAPPIYVEPAVDPKLFIGNMPAGVTEVSEACRDDI
jgi:RNA recognition motif-containing protein